MLIEQVTVDGLAAAMEEDIVLLDVREADELAEARVPGVLHIPLAEIPVRIGEIPDGDLYVICRSGARSLVACEQLVAAGRSATNVAGGTAAWLDSGRATESG